MLVNLLDHQIVLRPKQVIIINARKFTAFTYIVGFISSFSASLKRIGHSLVY